MPRQLTKLNIQPQFENGTYEEIVLILEKELQLADLEAPYELKINTLTQQATQQTPEKPKPTCHHCKKKVTTEIGVVNSNERKIMPKTTRIVPAIITPTKTVFRQTLTSALCFPTIQTQTIQITEMT